MTTQQTKSSRGKKVLKVSVSPLGRAYVKASFNNILVTITNSRGDVVSWSSSGKMGFKGSKKSTPYAGQVAAERCAKLAYERGVRRVDVYVKGPGSGRESAIRSLVGAGLEVLSIQDITPVPHNGCRPAKRRRV